jgi:hypothetical protein
MLLSVKRRIDEEIGASSGSKNSRSFNTNREAFRGTYIRNIWFAAA